jgi:hypothetical protein
MLKRILKRCVVGLALLVTLVFASCGTQPATTGAPPPSATAPQVTATPAPVLTDLHTPEDLKAQFNRDVGVPRLILLVSPT